MPFTVQDLVEGSSDPITASPYELLNDALRKMSKNDFSQLPVANEELRPIGMLTYESILHAVHNFKVPLEELRVKDAMAKIVEADEFRSDADLSELLERLGSKYAVLIVDGDRHLTGIITNYDTSEYFHRRAEDLMLIEDIETMLKEFIQATFTTSHEEVDVEALDRAAKEISDWRKSEWDRFNEALDEYFILHSEGRNGALPRDDWLKKIQEKHYQEGPRPRIFEELFLSEYIRLFLKSDQWDKYSSILGLDQKVVYKLLDSVRQIRNTLAHFRDELTQEQREQLRFCAEWLTRHQSAIEEKLIGIEFKPEPINIQVSEQIIVGSTESIETNPSQDVPSSRESRYAPFAIWLQERPSEMDSVQLSFEQIEKIIGGDLPSSASTHRAWWANDSVGHVQSKQWLEVGWKVKSINMTDRVVVFSRIRVRQKAYNQFFSELLNKLRQQTEFANIEAKPASKFWQQIESITVSGKHFAIISYSFRRGGIFRIELYIDAREHDLNNQLFSGLFDRRGEIESRFGDKLIWEELPNNRASRVAAAHAGSITDEQEELDELQKWAIENLAKFRSAIQQPATEEAERAIAQLNET